MSSVHQETIEYESDNSVDFDLIAIEKLPLEVQKHLRKGGTFENIPSKKEAPLPKKTKSFKEVCKRISTGFFIGALYFTSFAALPVGMIIYPFLVAI